MGLACHDAVPVRVVVAVVGYHDRVYGACSWTPYLCHCADPVGLFVCGDHGQQSHATSRLSAVEGTGSSRELDGQILAHEREEEE